MTNDIIKIDDLSFAYTEDHLISNLNFKVKAGEFVLIVGENGSGKSTLLKLILGEVKPNAGSIQLMGNPINNKTDFRSIGYVPQMQLVSRMGFPISCLEMVVLNLTQHFGMVKIPRRSHHQLALEQLKQLGLEAYRNTPLKELSGGLQQRVMIARALINQPSILILDEPTAGIDQENKEQFLSIIDQLNKEKCISIILVTHEQTLVQEQLKLNHYYRMENGGLTHVTV